MIGGKHCLVTIRNLAIGNLATATATLTDGRAYIEEFKRQLRVPPFRARRQGDLVHILERSDVGASQLERLPYLGSRCLTFPIEPRGRATAFKQSYTANEDFVSTSSDAVEATSDFLPS